MCPLWWMIFGLERLILVYMRVWMVICENRLGIGGVEVGVPFKRKGKCFRWEGFVVVCLRCVYCHRGVDRYGYFM